MGENSTATPLVEMPDIYGRRSGTRRSNLARGDSFDPYNTGSRWRPPAEDPSGLESGSSSEATGGDPYNSI